MELKFKVSGHISKPVGEVFEAVVDPKMLSQYFTTGGAQGRLETGSTVYWDFHDFPGAFPVHVEEVERNRKVVLRWGGEDAGTDDPEEAAKRGTTVTMDFEELEDGRTLVTITEEGWPETEAGLSASYGNCMGWSQMICAMKVWLEHGINLREKMYK